MQATTSECQEIRDGLTAPPALVDADWLEAHLDDPDVRVVEVDVAPVRHEEWHIDGAVLWDIYADLKDPDYRLVDAGRLQQVVRLSGIAPESTVVFYGYAPAMGVWLMELFGHRDVRLLDCSREAWQAEGRPWTTTATTSASVAEATEYALPAVVNPNPNPNPIRASLADVGDAIDGADTVLLDVRTQAEYLGERFWPSGGMQPDGRAGHVPSALLLDLEPGDLYDDRGAFRDPQVLRDRFASVLLDDREVITYCAIGGRASTAWFVLTHVLGRQRVRVYDGSWAEWGRTPGAPVANGP
jgi:thiosulfate/3-mercaptopyruvate sulfurtransferase